MFLSTWLKTPTKTKFARSLNRHRVVIFAEFFWEVIFRKSPYMRDFKQSKNPHAHP